MHKHSIECKIIDGDRKGEIEFIPRITLLCNDQYPFTLSRHQFPLRLAFSFTIIKSQGQTLDKVGIDLRSEVFSHGQLYVALSRARSFESIKVRIGGNVQSTKNIVYKNLIDDNL
jgi:ATP-dependent exoDNAse (exonuclease V) alpha subunit